MESAFFNYLDSRRVAVEFHYDHTADIMPPNMQQTQGAEAVAMVLQMPLQQHQQNSAPQQVHSPQSNPPHHSAVLDLTYDSSGLNNPDPPFSSPVNNTVDIPTQEILKAEDASATLLENASEATY